jgi:hypothetical protein
MNLKFNRLVRAFFAAANHAPPLLHVELGKEMKEGRKEGRRENEGREMKEGSCRKGDDEGMEMKQGRKEGR